ncbi:MAG: GspE/PulE family protein [bacterium]
MSYDAAFMERHGVVLLDERPAEVRVGTGSEPDARLRRLLQSFHCKRVSFVRLPPDELTVRIQRAASRPDADWKPGDARARDESARFGVGIYGTQENAPAVNLVNSLLNDAASRRASDIHIELHDGSVVVRYRVDGVLCDASRRFRDTASAAGDESSTDVPLLRPEEFPAVSARLKVLAGLNAAERRRPQDGRFTARLRDDAFDVRFSSMPTVCGESIVLRLFRRTREAFRLAELGMPKAILDHVRAAVERPAGFVLISGPTGCGKTTTLHAALRHLDRGARKIITIEDPVEYRLPGIEQIQTNESAGLTFESLLRRVLRQDPDVIMVGEIRDRATADLSVRAALTGHLVLATVHSRSARDVRDRLVDLGVERSLLDLLGPTLLAQRLVRRRCRACGTAESCPRCFGTGYAGRTGLFELVAPDGSYVPLAADGTDKVARGVTTKEEVAWATAI